MGSMCAIQEILDNDSFQTTSIKHSKDQTQFSSLQAVTENESIKQEQKSIYYSCKLSTASYDHYSASQLQYQNQSTLKQSVNLICTFCQQLGFTNMIQVSCYHTFHEKCLITLCEKQLILGETKLLCVCYQKLKIQFINIRDKQILINQLFYNQLKEIKMNHDHEYLNCPGYRCDYFQIGSKVSYCPICNY